MIIIKHYFTKKQYEDIIQNNFVVLVDTKEQKNEHILSWFESNGIKYKKKSLKTGDYSFMVTANPELGIMSDQYFTDEICIERKNSVNEIASNFASVNKDDDRIMRELNRMINIDMVYLLIEDDNLSDLIEGRYRSNINAMSLFRSILTWQARNGMKIYFVDKELMGRIIYELCLCAFNSQILR